jgi:hypothetical protein
MFFNKVERALNKETCKLLVNSILLLANPCYIRACKTATIEWE